MKTIDHLSGIEDGVIGETEPARPQFDVHVPQEFQIGPAANRTHTMIVLDPRSVAQHAFILPRDGAVEFARQLLVAEQEMAADEAKNAPASKVLLPGLGRAPNGAARHVPVKERLR